MLDQILERAAERTFRHASVETRLKLQSAQDQNMRRVVRPALPERNHATLLKLIQLDWRCIRLACGRALHCTCEDNRARPQKAYSTDYLFHNSRRWALEVLLAPATQLVVKIVLALRSCWTVIVPMRFV